MTKFWTLIIIIFISILSSCRKDKPIDDLDPGPDEPTPYDISDMVGYWNLSEKRYTFRTDYLCHDSILYFSNGYNGFYFSDSVVGFSGNTTIYHCVDYLDGSAENKHWYTTSGTSYKIVDSGSVVIEFWSHLQTDSNGDSILTISILSNKIQYKLLRTPFAWATQEVDLLVQFENVLLPENGMLINYRNDNSALALDSMFIGNWQWSKTVHQTTDTLIYEITMTASQDFLDSLTENFYATFYMTMGTPLIGSHFFIGSAKFSTCFAANAGCSETIFTRSRRVTVLPGD